MSDLYLGLMSGTSMDAVDVCLATFGDTPQLLATLRREMPAPLRQALHELIECNSGDTTLARIGQLDAELGELFAAAALELLGEHRLQAGQVRAIGSHGQTVWHQPQGPYPFSLQLGDPARIAERTGITTVADFRRRDIAAGGQGAPLVPAFHAAIFHSNEEYRVILNIGGMANITLLPADSAQTTASGFDTGPGNVLLDLHAQRHLDTDCDIDGALAAQGRCDPALLAAMLDDPYFALPPPKSTGREYFNARWLDHHLSRHSLPAAADVQATLAELTARSIAGAIEQHMPDCSRVLVCGGGVHNGHLMERLAALLPHSRIEPTTPYGIEPDWVEAMAFAWLAQQTVTGRPGNLPAVTGASRPVILGAIHPA
jgi:anhydro-N-acetylmuramic acid kinase